MHNFCFNNFCFMRVFGRKGSPLVSALLVPVLGIGAIAGLQAPGVGKMAKTSQAPGPEDGMVEAGMPRQHLSSALLAERMEGQRRCIWKAEGVYQDALRRGRAKEAADWAKTIKTRRQRLLWLESLD